MSEALAQAAGQARPFEVDPAVMAGIRPMQHRDAARVAQLHQAAMGNSLWARLGHRFLESLYQGLIDSDHFLAFVYETQPGRIGGFIAGSCDTDAMMGGTFRRIWPVLGIAAIPRVFKPAILRRILETPLYSRASRTVELPAGLSAESLFCSFVPELRGRRVAGHVNKVLFDDFLARGHRYVKITTEVSNTGANRQLKSWGFADCGRFTFYGKEMVTYVLDLQASDRVEPVSRHPRI